MEPTPWPNRFVSDCGHPDNTTWQCEDPGCIWPCDRCADDPWKLYVHEHCDCGAINCHRAWWRHRRNRDYRTDPNDPRTGLDKVRDAIRAARGGDAPVQIRGYA
jgi:hypothetical protein